MLARLLDRSSNISKPTLDLILFNIQLGRSIGGYGSLGLAVSYVATAWVLRKVTPAFGKLAAIEAKLEGDFRAAHSRLIINAEEIACVTLRLGLASEFEDASLMPPRFGTRRFYDGAHIEKDILNRAYLRLIKHVNSIFKVRAPPRESGQFERPPTRADLPPPPSRSASSTAWYVTRTFPTLRLC